MEILLFQPPTWQSVVIRDKNRAKQLIAEGWRTAPPNTETKTNQETIELIAKPVSSETLFINRMTVSALTKINGVGTVTANRIVNAQPIESIEELTEITDRVDWLTLNISFEL